MRCSWHKALFGVVCCVFAAAPGFAQSAAVKGDPSRGRILFNSCIGCHGIPTYNYPYPQFNVPKLGGQNYKYIVNALKAYASGKRTNPTMQAQASSLSEQDIRDIAAFLSQPKP